MFQRVAVFTFGLLFVLGFGSEPRMAEAGPLLTAPQVRIEGAGGFPGGGFTFPFTLAAPPGETVLDVDVPLTPPGFPVPLYSLEARTEIGVVGNDLVQTSKFSLQCRILGTGCGRTTLRFVGEGTLELEPGTELKEVQFIFSDLNYTGSNGPVPVTLGAELNMASVAATPGVAVAATQDVAINHTQEFEVSNDPFLETIVRFALEAHPDTERPLYTTFYAMDMVAGGNISRVFEGDGFFASKQTFEMRLITGPIEDTTATPTPGTFALLGLGLAGLGFSRRKSKSL